MKLHDREPVVGTTATIYIGHRFHKDKGTGEIIISKKWHAEYNHLGSRLAEPLKTTYKAKAIRAAHMIVQRLERGDPRVSRSRVEWQEMYDACLAYLESKGRAPKTLTKYRSTLKCGLEQLIPSNMMGT